MARNERTTDLSKEFEVSPGRISQMRQEFHDDWLRFHGEGVPSRKRAKAHLCCGLSGHSAKHPLLGACRSDSSADGSPS